MKKTLQKAAGLVFTAFAAMLLFGANGEAYIDPSVMTYIIQAVAGIIIAVGAVVGIYWRRARKKVNDTLGIDENRNKEVESDELVVSEAAEEKTEEAKE
jgi:NhaP-type Na+/H+ or K+/H+ antiporter